MSKPLRSHPAASRHPDPLFVLDGNTPSAQRSGAVNKINVVEHPIALHALTALRNRQTAPELFRVFSHQLLTLLAVEATRGLPVREEAVETVWGSHPGRVLGQPIVFLSLSRRGLGLAHHMTDLIPNVRVGMISLDHADNGQHFSPRLHLVNAPALGESLVILFDPVVATGLSASLALDLLQRSGAVDVTLLSFLVSVVGLERVQGAWPDLTVWTAAIDTEWDSKRGPLPGIGVFGERFYG